MEESELHQQLEALLEHMHKALESDGPLEALRLLESCSPPLKATGTWLNARGMIAFRMGEFGIANDFLQQALTVQGPVAEILSNIGAVYLEQAKGSAGLQQRQAYESAVEKLTEALNIDPAQPNIHTNLALAHILAGQITKAELCLEAALAINPLHPEALFQKAQLLYEQGSLADSLKLIDTILEHYPERTEARTQRNLILDRLSF